MLIDLGHHRRADTRIGERNPLFDLAAKIARIGSFTYDHATQKVQLSTGCAAIYGLPEGTLEISREDWRALVHPDDLRRLDAVTRRALANCETEFVLEFRILLHGEVKWIELRVLILYNEVGRAVRRIGAQVDVTDRKRAELALAERNTQLELASKTARVGSLAIDLSTAHVNLSPGCATILGLPEGILETSRNNVRKLIHPEDIALLDAARDQALLKKQREFVAQFRITRADDGEVRWLEVRSIIFYDRGGEPVRLIAVIIDVTDRKRAEDTLHQRESELVEAQRLARIGSWHWDAEFDVIVGSGELLRIFGLDAGTRHLPAYREQRGRWYPDDDWKRLKAAMKSTMQTGVSYELELQAFRNGTPIWITARGAVVRNSRNQIVGLRGTVQEITDRKLAELELAERNTQLELASKAARVGYYSNNLETGLITVSEGYAAIHGLPEGTVQTTLSEWRSRVHPDDLAPFDELREQIFGDRRTDFTFDYRLIRDGGVRWIELRGCVSYDEDGLPQQCIGINIDVTERKQTEARLSDALSAGRVVAFEWDAVTCRSQRSDNAEHILGIVHGGVFFGQVHPADRGNFKAVIRNVSPGNPSYRSTFRFARSDGRDVWLEEEAKAEFDTIGKLLRIKGLTRDITERKELEDHKNTLIAELDHRVKNVLATISAIASRTKETSSSRAEFVTALDGRIRSMASTHELLSSRHWQGIPLAALVHRELAPYATASNVRIDGPDVVLRAETGQILAMVFHELATNAAKFGAISAKSGRVAVRWSFRCNGGAESRLSIRWEESGGPPVVQPTGWGFGTSVVRELVPYELGGTVELAHLPEGVRCNLHIPAQWLSASAR